MQILYPVLEWQANSILSTAHFRNSSKDFFWYSNAYYVRSMKKSDFLPPSPSSLSSPLIHQSWRNLDDGKEKSKREGPSF